MAENTERRPAGDGRRYDGGGTAGTNRTSPDGPTARPLAISWARRRDAKRWKAETVTWADLPGWLGLATPADHKECGNYVLGALDGPTRSNETVQHRSAVALDADSLDPAARDDLLARLADAGYAALVHTTFQSTAEAPRLRILIQTDRDMLPDEYRVLARVLMVRLGWDRFDHSSAEPARYMFRPSAQEPDTYRSWTLEGAPLLVGALLLDEQMDPTVPPEPDRVEASAAGGPAYADLTPAEQRHAAALVQRREDGWRQQLADALVWPEGHRDERGRGWERLVADAADTFAALAHSPWNALTLDEAEALYDEVVPEPMADAVPAKWSAKCDGSHARRGIAWEPLGAEFDALPPQDDQADAPDDPKRQRSQWADGGAFLFDQPEQVPLIWGTGDEALWAEGEALMLAGPPGVGKTSLTGQLVRALLFGGEVLGWPVTPATGRVLYLAMDRPRQIARALRRHFTPDERDVLAQRLVVWQGPPRGDMAKEPELLRQLAEKAGATHVVVDSLKDAALGLTEETGAAGYNRARQVALAAGVQVLELHHLTKRGPNGKAPTTLADLYGGMPITAGAGSVLLLWAEVAGAQRVALRHLKPILEPVRPAEVEHDHRAGVSRRTGQGHVTPVQRAAAWMDQEGIDLDDGERLVLPRVRETGHSWSRDVIRAAIKERRERAARAVEDFTGEAAEVPQ